MSFVVDGIFLGRFLFSDSNHKRFSSLLRCGANSTNFVVDTKTKTPTPKKHSCSTSLFLKIFTILTSFRIFQIFQDSYEKVSLLVFSLHLLLQQKVWRSFSWLDSFFSILYIRFQHKKEKNFSMGNEIFILN